MKRFTREANVTFRSQRTAKSTPGTPSATTSLATAISSSASGRPSANGFLRRQVEERFKGAGDQRKRTDSTCNFGCTTRKCAEPKRAKVMGGSASKKKQDATRGDSGLGVRAKERDGVAARSIRSKEHDGLVAMSVRARERDGDIATSVRARELDSGELSRTLTRMQETSEQLQATELEISQLRTSLSIAKRTNEVLARENSECVQKIDSLTKEVEKFRNAEKRIRVQRELLDALKPRTKVNVHEDYEAKENELQESDVEANSNRRLLEQNEKLHERIGQLCDEKENLEGRLAKTKEELASARVENARLVSEIESEREEWSHMQADLLVAVKVANDFKLEAQEELQRLSAALEEMRKRRLSSSQSPQVPPAASQSWEDSAWERLLTEYNKGTRYSSLLQWCRAVLGRSGGAEVTNFSSSWADGRALCHLLISLFPDSINVEKVEESSVSERLRLAEEAGRRLGVRVEPCFGDQGGGDARLSFENIMKYLLSLYHLASSAEHRAVGAA